ncbi:MAG TPA: hypothetical protein VMV52_09750 [Candidatus Nanopelagicaceae bacterium]|nr:hypothetical protein [Candidatus Nanopelagicaceae bacterium]
MTNHSLEQPTFPLAHSHAERWMPAADLPTELKRLAQDVLPILKHVKRLMIGLASLAIDESSRERVPAVASDLSLHSRRSAQMIDEHRDSQVEVLVAEPIASALNQLGVWAQVASANGMTAETASGLRTAYKSLRRSCQILWPSELVPEGRVIDSGVQYG